MNKVQERAKRILKNNNYMILATVQGDQPWSTPVFYAYDKQYNFYWYSRKDTRHSQNIQANNHVAASIFGVGNADEGFGVYLKGNAAEVTEEELEHALHVYAEKATHNQEQRDQLTTKEDFLGDAPIRMYKLVPEKMYVFNESTKWKGKWIDSKSEITLLLQPDTSIGA
jgi:uncharacterized protein YhbP (UPF0306 family)